MNHLEGILARKRAELARRLRHSRAASAPLGDEADPRARASRTEAALKRSDDHSLRVIAEIKRCSPSEGLLRPFAVGDVAKIAESYRRAGAAAVSVLADRQGFGGSPLDVRRAARSAGLPVLFKEFVLHEVQLELARRVGASLVLLLVRALERDELERLVEGCYARGLAPVVEAADGREVDVALTTSARIIGINARDLASFSVDPDGAGEALRKIPNDRIAVYMSGVSRPEHLRDLATSRADAVLIGSALMRANDPGVCLRTLLGAE